jgi:hypothetical protein
VTRSRPEKKRPKVRLRHREIKLEPAPLMAPTVRSQLTLDDIARRLPSFPPVIREWIVHCGK